MVAVAIAVARAAPFAVASAVGSSVTGTGATTSRTARSAVLITLLPSTGTVASCFAPVGWPAAALSRSADPPAGADPSNAPGVWPAN